MKKGISLIVLVITIIVMIIIAGAIILSLNSSNVTGKASWAQISSDRANLQAEYATILASAMAAEEADTDFIGVTVEDVQKVTPAYTNWVSKINTHKSGRMYVEGLANNTNPAGVKVVVYMTGAEAVSFGLTDDATATSIPGYDWVRIGTKPATPIN